MFESRQEDMRVRRQAGNAADLCMFIDDRKPCTHALNKSFKHNGNSSLHLLPYADLQRTKSPSIHLHPTPEQRNMN